MFSVRIQEHLLARFKWVMMSSVWTCRICGTYASFWWGCPVMCGNVGLEPQELRNGDRWPLVVIGVLGGEEVNPSKQSTH